MSEQKMISEVDAIKRERAAFESGVGTLWIQDEISGGPGPGEAYERALAKAASSYPLPKVTRPRVVPDPIAASAQEWTVNESGYLLSRKREVTGWRSWVDYRNDSDFAPLPQRVAMWADLLANPMETVEAE